MTSQLKKLLTFIFLLSDFPSFGFSKNASLNDHMRIIEFRTGKIPPKPNFTFTLTAKPDPYETDDPTTQAKMVLRRDLFGDKNGEILFYALLDSLQREPVLPVVDALRHLSCCNTAKNRFWIKCVINPIKYELSSLRTDLKDVALKNYSESPKNGTWNISEDWLPIPNWQSENTSYQVTPRKWDPFKGNSKSASYILGDGTCDNDNYYCNKPLRENTKYTLKIRAFTDSGYQDTDVICFETLENLPVSSVISILGGLFLVTSVAVCLSIFDFGRLKKVRLFPGGKSKDSFSPVPESLSQKSFLKYAEGLLNTPGRLGNEFHLLGTLSSDLSTLCLHAQRVDNRMKNRYGNILPFDMTRVNLSVIDDDPSTDYINASYIKGFKNKVEYIASQGPKEETCHDFYRMIIEHNIEVIVMLTKLVENGNDKCCKYYPDKNKILKIKDIMITCTDVTELEICTKRTFEVLGGGRRLFITQFHLTQWQDFECPESPEVMLKLCGLLDRFRRSLVLVHCSAGSGRTGTFIAIDILLQEVKSNSKISVFNTVLKLRQQRINMVQTEAQLGYIYKCVSSAIEKNAPKISAAGMTFDEKLKLNNKV